MHNRFFRDTCKKKPIRTSLKRRMGFGVPEAIRTPDARFRKPTLYPLSYWDMGSAVRRLPL